MSSQKKKSSRRKTESGKQSHAEARQGRRFLFVWVPVIILVLAFFYALMFDPPRPAGPPLTGTIGGPEEGQRGRSVESIVLVTLETGRSVEVPLPEIRGSLRKGRRVLVQENETLIFKRRTYSFVRWLDSD